MKLSLDLFLDFSLICDTIWKSMNCYLACAVFQRFCHTNYDEDLFLPSFKIVLYKIGDKAPERVLDRNYQIEIIDKKGKTPQKSEMKRL